MAASPTKIAVCPDPDVLGQIASGSMIEAEAEVLFKHIDRCDLCQNRMDALARQDDGVLKRARRISGKDAHRPQLSQLIRKAQTLGPREATVSAPEKESIPVEGFVSGLRRCGLFPEEEVDALLSDVTATDSSTMARELVSRQKLTPFQARVLLRGRWKGLVLGNYVLLEKLGQGGMGSVFKAKHRRLGRVVCVKVMNSAGRKSPEMIERFRNEARTVAALSHPNFVVAHDADEAEGVPFLVMEYVEGQDLARHISVHGPLPIRQSLEVLRQAATALQYAHDEGVTHRDIKPHNLMLSKDAESGELTVTILDLGLARFDSLLNDNPNASLQAAMTNTGVIMGTVDYLSPEQALRSRDADNRSDIYSLGCTLHYLMTGRPVFEGDTVMARLVAHREQVVPSLEQQCFGAIRYLDDVFFRMLAKDPSHRYESMQEVADDVTALLTGQVPFATGHEATAPESVLQQVRRHRRKPAYAFWLITGILFCAACVGLWAALVKHEAALADDTSPRVKLVESEPEEVPFGLDDVNHLTVKTDFGNPGLITRGGSGNALIIVPHHGPKLQQFLAWEDALKKLDIDVMCASSQPGTPKTKSGYQDMPHAADLDDPGISIDQVDMILFTGGSIEEFDTPRLRNKLTTLLNSALPRGVVIGTFADARYAALSSTDTFCGKSGQDGAVKFRSPAFQLGEVMEINDPRHALELVTRAKTRREQLRDQIQDPSAATSLSVTEAGILRKFSGFGRALIIVPFDDYNWQEYQAVRDALESDKHNMNVLITSSQFGSPRTNDDNATEFSTDITLDQFSPKYFDAVVFIGGDINGFDQEDTRQNLQRIIDGAMHEGLVIASASRDSLELMKLTGIAEYLNESSKGKVRFGHPPKSTGSVVATEKYSHASTLVDKLIALRDQAIKQEQLGDTRKD